MAATGVNVKMGVSGVSQFKNGMNQAKQAAKTLDAQLALTEKEFKATGDAEAYMTKKTEELKAKLEAQKSVVENAQQALDAMAKNGVDKSSTAYQKLYQEMLKAKGEMLDTENALNGITDAGDKAADGVSEMNAQLKNIGDGVSWQNISSGLEGITSKLEKAGQTAWNFGKKLVQATLGAGSWADELATEAKTLGLDTDTLQRMRYTSNIIDTSVEAIVNAKKRLKKERAGESKETMGAFAALGIDPSEAKDADDLFWKTGEALMKLGDEYDQEAYAQKLFGRSWNELIPLFEAGRQQYEETNASWNVLSDDQIESLTKMDDEYQKLNQQFENLKMTALSEFAEPMQKAMEKINELLGKFTEWLQSEEGQRFVDGVINKLNEGLDWIINNKDDVVAGLTAIAGAFALIKITTLAANIGKFVTGVKGLVGGGTPPTTTGTEAATGGFMTGAWNKMTAASASASNVIQTAGGLMPVVFDRILNETNFGRAIRDGGNILEGLAQDVEEKKAEIEHNAATIGEDWDNNVLTQPGKNSIRFWDDFWSNVLTGGSGWKWGPQGEGTGSDWTDEEAQDLTAAISRMTDEITGGSDSTRQSNSEMTQAASKMKGLPAETAEAVRQALNGAQVRIDGGLMSAYVGEVFAQWVASHGGN